jgi:hypothetical protein
MKVWIAQLKCPNNHCVVGMAAEITEDEAADLEAKLWSGFRSLVDAKKLNYECGICKSKNLHADVRPSMFDTLEEAKPALEESQRQQIATAEYLWRSKN